MKLTVYLLLLATSVVQIAADVVSGRTTIPALLGPYKVAISTHEVNTTRDDPLAPKKRNRRFMVVVYQPLKACKQSFTSYAPPRIQNLLDSNKYQVDVPNGTFSKLQLENCQSPDLAGITNSPLVIFSPGLEESSYYFGATNEALASSGYTVVALEHTYESPAVLFPDGEIAQPNLKSNFSSPDEAYAYSGDVLTPIRSADATSALDAIGKGQIPGLERYEHQNLKSVIFGHSLGGCTAVDAIAADKRFIGGIDFDGSILGHVNNITLSKPFFLVTETGEPPSIWKTLWNNLKGWKLQIAVKKTGHEGFMDFPLIADLLGTRGSPPQSPDRIGTIKGKTIQKIIWAYTTAFFDFVFEGTESDLLNSPSSEYPQVIFQRKSEK